MAKRWTTFMLALCVLASGCTYNSRHYAARPVSATLEIEVNGQWRTVQRMTYNYETMPLADLERILRDRESRGDFGAETTALRVLIECRKAGLNPREK